MSLPCSASWHYAPSFLLQYSPDVGVPFPGAGGRGKWSRENVHFHCLGREYVPSFGRLTAFGSTWQLFCLRNSSSMGKAGSLNEEESGQLLPCTLPNGGREKAFPVLPLRPCCETLSLASGP